MSYAILFKKSAAQQIQQERAWLITNRGRSAADTFEDELAHALDLLEECPAMGAPSPWSEDERRVFLRGSRHHLYYRLYPEGERILIVRIRHEKQGPLKR